MLAAGVIIATLVALAIAAGYAVAWAVGEAAISEAEASGDYPYLTEGVKAGAESFRAGGAKVGADLRNANQLGVQVQNSTSQNPGSTTGRVAD